MDLFKKLITLENDATRFGFSWETATQIIAQIQSECLEITADLENSPNASNRTNLQEEIGDLLHAAFSLCVFCKFDPEDTLEKSIAKFEKRLHAVKQLAYQQGMTTLIGCSFNELMKLWDQAKKTVG